MILQYGTNQIIYKNERTVLKVSDKDGLRKWQYQFDDKRMKLRTCLFLLFFHGGEKFSDFRRARNCG